MGKTLTMVEKRARPRRTPAPKRVASSQWLSPQQAAAHIGVSVDTIYEACRSKGLRHAKVGQTLTRIRPAWLDEWMESKAKAS